MAQEAVETQSLQFLSAIEQATVTAIENAEKSIVAIARVGREREPGLRAGLDPLHLRNDIAFQSPLENPDFVPKFFGSGVVLSQDGFIVTCAHVLDDPREHDYFVWLDKRGYRARVVGRPAKVYAADPFSDLAVLKIDEIGLTPITFGDAGNLRKGMFVIALGNPDAIAMDGQASASWGMISNLNRVAPADARILASVNKETIHQYGTLIQTDARLGLGSSGGALVNLRGQMIGLTTSLVARAGFENAAGFAIATDEMFRRVVEALKSGKMPEYGFLGIQPEDIELSERKQGLRGARISVVIAGLPGDQAGLLSGDLIIQVDQRLIDNRNDLFRELSLAAAGKDIELLVQRGSPGSQPTLVKLTAHLSKKFVATSRSAFAINTPASWRGMSVEYTTAVPSGQARIGFLGGGRNPPPKVAVLEVEPNTAAWEVGLRPGFGILSVAARSIETPEQFREIVQSQTGNVELVVVGMDGRSATVVIPVDQVTD